MKKLISAFTAVIVMICAVSNSVFADTASDSCLNRTIGYTVNTLFADGSQQFGDEWYIIALARSGNTSVSGVLDKYYLSAAEDLKAKDGEYKDSKGNQSLNDYIRVMMALTAMGRDVTDFAGYDLCSKISSLDFTDYQNSSTSTLAYALDMIYLYSDKIADAQSLKEKVCAEIMTRYMDDTGFTYMTGEYASVDPDTTAQTIQVLGLIDNSDEINKAIENSYAYLRSQQGDDGAIASWGAANPSSTAQCLISAAMLDEDKYAEFTAQSGKSLVDGLMMFELDNGGFYEPYYGVDAGADYYTTSQALLGLTAIYRMEHDMKPLYDFSDVSFVDNKTETTQTTPVTTQAGQQGQPTVTSAPAATSVKQTAVSQSPATSDTAKSGMAAVVGVIALAALVMSGTKKN
ncbi:MAG: terpene cyclase/mutase family protein [Oscillospiraceae bacterium]|nr:terpene cyclase/mutase family protein [Oscillospiraceae bacterium]